MDHDYLKRPRANKSRNTRYCCVPQCGTYGAPGISFHLFPKDKIMKKKWQLALRIAKPISPAMRVCSHHFQPSNYFPNNSKRQKLFRNAIPSRNIPKRSTDKEVPLAQKIKSNPRKNRSDIRQRKIDTTKKDLGLALEDEQIDVTKLQRKSKSPCDSFNRPYAKVKINANRAASTSEQCIDYNQPSFLNCVKEEIPDAEDAPTVETNDAKRPRPQFNRKSTEKFADMTENEIIQQPLEEIKRENETLLEDYDPDKHFFMSLLPHVRKIDDRCKLDFKTDVLLLINKYVGISKKNPHNESYSGPCYGIPCQNAHEYPTQHLTTWVDVPPETIIKSSPPHSNCSDQSGDNNSVIEDMFQDNE